MKKAFTIIELIVVIVVLGILASIGSMKMFASMDAKAVAKFNSDYMMVVGGIDSKFSKTISSGKFKFVSSLEKDIADSIDNGAFSSSSGYVYKKEIFDNVLQTSVISSEKNSGKSSSWVYLGTKEKTVSGVKKYIGEYEFYISSSKYLKLTYDSSNGVFSCDEFKCIGCSELNKMQEGLKASCKKATSK